MLLWVKKHLALQLWRYDIYRNSARGVCFLYSSFVLEKERRSFFMYSLLEKNNICLTMKRLLFECCCCNTCFCEILTAIWCSCKKRLSENFPRVDKGGVKYIKDNIYIYFLKKVKRYDYFLKCYHQYIQEPSLKKYTEQCII